MTYGHAQRNLDALLRLEDETARLLESLEALDHKQEEWLTSYESARGESPHS